MEKRRFFLDEAFRLFRLDKAGIVFNKMSYDEQESLKNEQVKLIEMCSRILFGEVEFKRMQQDSTFNRHVIYVVMNFILENLPGKHVNEFN